MASPSEASPQGERGRQAAPPDSAPLYYEEVETAYSRLAPTYDMAVGMNPVAARAKAVAIKSLSKATKPGDLLLDIGCGPGQEAVVLARRGYRVLGIDSSDSMVELARERAKGLAAGAVEFRRMRAGDVGDLSADGLHFDAAYSFYAVLNLEPRLEAVARGVFSLLPEGAPFLVGLLNPTVLFELAGYPIAGRLKGFRKAAQRPVRLKLSRGGTEEVTCYLYPPGAFARLFAPWFALERLESVHLFLPPPDERMLRFPALVRGVNRIEARLEPRWPFNRLGYFSLLTLRRREAPS